MTPPGGAPDLDALLRDAVRRDASDVHLVAGEAPALRVDGRLHRRAGERELTGADTEAVARTVLSGRQWERFQGEGELDVSFSSGRVCRFRCSVYRQRGTVALAIRCLPREIPDFGELGLPDVVPTLAERPRGLVLVTGPTGSGKSTTLAAMVDRINRERHGHVVTVEDPIEFVHADGSCVVSQREVGTDTASFPAALRGVLRQDADVVLIGEMRDAETVRFAHAIAETGHLALATLHTNSAAESVDRILGVFPPGERSRARAQLASVLVGVVTQVLLPRSDGAGRVPACEVMVATPAVRSLIREEKEHQLPSAIQTGRKHGMQTLNDGLHALHVSGAASLRDCLAASNDARGLRRRLGAPDGESAAGPPGPRPVA